MAGQPSGKAPGQTPYAPGGAEVWSDSDHDYFTDPYFTREGSLNQIHQRDADVDRLYKTKRSQRYAGGGAINTTPHFDTGGVNQMPAFGYNPEAYVGEASGLARDMTARGNDMYNWASGLSSKNEGTANQVIGSAMNNANLFDNAAAAGLSRYQNMYGPAMAQHLAFAQNFGSAPEVEAARGRGIASVGQAYDQQTAAAADALRGEGLDPKAIASRLDSSVRTQRAAAGVAQGNTDALNRQVAGETMLGQSIGLGQADASLTNQFAGMGAADRNQAINAGNATLQTGTLAKSAALPFQTAGATELQQWPKAELDSMHAQNEYGALWNDINRTNIQGQQVANAQGSGVGAIAGGLLGAASNMVKFAPITLSRGGMIPHAADGGSTWRKFAYANPIGVPEPIEEGAIKTGQKEGFASGLKAGQGGGGNAPFEFKWPTSGETSPTQPTDSGTWAGDVQPVAPTGTGLQGQYAPEDFMAGGQFADTMGAGWGYKRGGVIKRFANAGSVPSTTDNIEGYSRQLTSMDPTGYAGFASDALALGRDAFDPSAQGPQQVPGDKFGIVGPTTYDQGEQIGGDVGRPIGRFVGGLFGMPGPGAAAGEGLGTGVGEMVQGNFGKGFEDIGRAALNAGEAGLSQGMGVLGRGGGGDIENLIGGGGGAGSAVTDAGSWGDMGGMGFARGGQIPMGPLGHLAHFIAGGAAGPYDPTAPVTPPQTGAIQTGDVVPASAQVPGIEGPDNVPAMVAEGEGILPQRFMRWRGEQWLQKEIAKADKEMQKPQVAGPEDGPTPQAAIQTGPTFASPGAAQGAPA